MITGALTSSMNSAIAQITDNTCITIRPRVSADTNWISIVDDGGCWSYVGMTKGMQELSLSQGCRTVSNIQI